MLCCYPIPQQQLLFLLPGKYGIAVGVMGVGSVVTHTPEISALYSSSISSIHLVYRKFSGLFPF